MYKEELYNDDGVVVQENTKSTLNSAKLNAWLLQNIQIMQELTEKEPVCWREVDTPG